MMGDIREIPVALVDVPAGRRKVSPAWVAALADDIAAHRQRTPIEVIATGERFRLVSGAHRLGAQRLREAETILAIVRDASAYASEAEIKLAEIAENLMRRELSVLDRALDVAAWREIYEAAKGEVKRGRKKKSQLETFSDTADLEAISARFSESFTEAAQEALKLDRNAVFRALKIATIIEPVRALIALHTLSDNQSELLALAAVAAKQQADVATLIVAGKAASVAEAVALLEGKQKPKPLSAYEKLSERFSRLKAAEQDRFFDLHREAIERWLGKAGA